MGGERREGGRGRKRTQEKRGGERWGGKGGRQVLRRL